MAFCIYKIKNLKGEELEGKCWCSDKQELVVSLRDKGFYIIQYKELGYKKNSLVNKNVSSKDLSLFCAHFFTLLSAGINISEALSILYNESLNKNIRKSLYEIREMVYQGAELSYCMKIYNNIYPEYLINMIKVGEESGKLENVVSNLSKFYHYEDKVKRKILKSMLYPGIIFLTSILIMEIMITNVIPVFLTTLNSLGAKIPLLTSWFILIATFVNNYFIYFAAAIVVTFLMLNYYDKLAGVKKFFHRFILYNKIIKDLMVKLASVRFSRTLGILLQSGIHIINAFEIACSVISNEYLNSKVKICLKEIRAGKSMSESIKSTEIFPSILYSMIRIGEETGTLPEMLLKFSEVMEEEVYNSIDKSTTLIEPAMIIVLSLVIGTMLVSLLLPMISIMDNL
ncbi:type II secretion system F family protein [Clostridium sp. SYSU_GA19001]|uniref:type II secretion system F family protein n=1 Tax=Clostridium caldaquaticum TaxID=2940653 RepID=UPI00207739D5|nr:type II secretion system F family protein [Clostridium caldaquaticum]MCM8711025.1 type II secretion system F family protein [Clostridium caldaquaticum]